MVRSLARRAPDRSADVPPACSAHHHVSGGKGEVHGYIAFVDITSPLRVNAYFHFCSILLHRPFPQNESAIKRCTSAATRIVGLFEVSANIQLPPLSARSSQLTLSSRLTALSKEPRPPVRADQRDAICFRGCDDSSPRPRHDRRKSAREASGGCSKRHRSLRADTARDGSRPRMCSPDRHDFRGSRPEVVPATCRPAVAATCTPRDSRSLRLERPGSLRRSAGARSGIRARKNPPRYGLDPSDKCRYLSASRIRRSIASSIFHERSRRRDVPGTVPLELDAVLPARRSSCPFRISTI